MSQVRIIVIGVYDLEVEIGAATTVDRKQNPGTVFITAFGCISIPRI